MDVALEASTSSCATVGLATDGALHFGASGTLCLTPLASGRVAALACADADDGQRWALDAFGSQTLINRARGQCLDVDTAGLPVLVECVDPPPQTQQWAANGTALALALDGRCLAATDRNLSDPPCSIGGPIVFSKGAGAPPAGAKLGVLPATLGGDLTLSAWVWAEDGNANWGRVLDLGNGAPNDNILLAFNGFGSDVRAVYQLYYGTSQKTGGSAVLTSARAVPLRTWLHIAVVHSGAHARMLWRDTSGSGWEEVGRADLAPAAGVARASNLVGVSNWQADPPFVGKIGGLAVYNRALQPRELDGLTTVPPAQQEGALGVLSGALALCAQAAPPPPPAPPIRAALALRTAAAGPAVEPELYGHDLEFTRHDLYEGFAAEMLANRKFATPSPPLSKWPAQVRQMAAAGVGGAPRWTAIGAAALDAPYWEANSSLVTGDLGHSVHCPGAASAGAASAGAAAAAPCGVSQGGFFDGFDAGMSYGSSLDLAAGAAYALRLVLRGGGATGGAKVVATLKSASGDVLWTHALPPLPATAAGWQEHNATITLASNTSNATLSVAAARGEAEWWLGSVSLTPVARSWRGMRTDVVAAVKQTGFRGLLRYPGGCFAPFYRWKVGLLPADQRPPVETPPGYCAAVAGGVNAYTSGFEENGIGIDEYIALCEELGMTPAITVRLQFGDEDEVAEAADWVEYCNGDASTTKFGALRAARGHPAPYNVQYWYLGNEISQQARYPAYPANQTTVPPPGADEYAAMLTRVVAGMEAASPGLPLRLLVVHAAWDAKWLAAVGDHVFATSYHNGYHDQPPVFSAAAVTAAAKAPLSTFVPALKGCRADLNKSGGAHVAISADEWGLGPPWKVSAGFSVAHALYAAGFLGAITREGPAAGLRFSNYFEPVNEGAVEVRAFGASLTPVGLVMAMYARHQGGARLALPAAASGGDLDVVATVDGNVVRATVANLNAVGWTTYALELALVPPPPAGTAVSVDTLTATGYDKGSTLVPSTVAAVVGANGTVVLDVPALSVVHATLHLN
eukprot:g2767.t1